MSEKRRTNRTADEVARIDSAILEVCDEVSSEFGAIGVRGVFYQLVSRIDLRKEDSEYRFVSARMTVMREDGRLPWEQVEDGTRKMSGGFFGHEPYPSALTQRERIVDSLEPPITYPKWYGQTHHCMIMCEKRGLTSILQNGVPIHLRDGVRIVPMGGNPSSTYVDDIAKEIAYHIENGLGVNCFYFGDLDEVGENIYASPSDKSLTKKLIRYLNRRLGNNPNSLIPPEGFNMDWTALTEEQAREYNLPRRVEKKKENARRDYAVDIDAMPLQPLQDLVRVCVEDTVDLNQVERVHQLNIAEHRKLETLRQRLDVVCDELADEGFRID